MEKVRIEIIAAINNRIFVVYYSARTCYQFSIIDEYGCTFDSESDIFYTAKKAEIEAKKALSRLSE